jgi:Ca2+/Na+ antiporter
MKKLYFILLGIISSIATLVSFFWCERHPEYDLTGLLLSNSLLALLSIVSYFMLQNKLKTGRPQAFVNGVYGATLLRLMACMGGIFIYIYLNKDSLHKPSLFAMMGLYIIYTAFESIMLSKIAKK